VQPYPTRHREKICAVVNVDCSRKISSLLVSVLNVRSLGRNSTVVSQLITDESLDIFATVKTWHDSFESPSVVAAAPSAYQVFERARPRVGRQATLLKTNHGRMCVFIKRDLQVSVIDLPLYKSFELLSLHVRFGHLSSVSLHPGSTPSVILLS